MNRPGGCGEAGHFNWTRAMVVVYLPGLIVVWIVLHNPLACLAHFSFIIQLRTLPRGRYWSVCWID